MQAGNLTEMTAAVMTSESIAAYIQYEQNRGASENALRNYKRVTASLYEWLPRDKTISKELLLAWRQNLKEHGYSQNTELNYIKGINRYLDHMGCSELRFNRGRAKDIAGKQFGYLTAIEPTGQKSRRDIIWRCQCKCGKEAAFTATRLLTCNALSCGCLRGEQLKAVNKYYCGTSLRQSMEERVFSTRAKSGYTGVIKKGDKWKAYIKYKGTNYSLGCYTKLEDAIKARARGKELVQLDALGLLDFYEELHKDDPARPNRAQLRDTRVEPAVRPQVSPRLRAIRSNNTSGCPGVSRKWNRWVAKITYQKVTYQLGSYQSIDDAIAARKEAERKLKEDPRSFVEEQGLKKELCV